MSDAQTEANKVRLIAFYLPQFHPIPENDEWWGKGFTEWRNVTKAKPLFPGHYQPHLPADMGFYDLRCPETRGDQAKLAREHGIYGFCYYHYWFNGRRILERPFNEVLASGKPDFPFCLCWANENWTRIWDGGHKHVLLEQKYTTEDDLAHIESLMPAFRDERYIRIDGRPLFLVYRTELMPDPARTAKIWREAARRAGIGELYLARVENFTNDDPRNIGFDAAVEFAPDHSTVGKLMYRSRFHRFLAHTGLLPRSYVENKVARYKAMANATVRRPDPDFTRFHCVTPSWDNSARRERGARLYVGSTPAMYGAWLRSTIEKTVRKFAGDERIIFLNAWNEWAEGNHLEPDLQWGRAYLEETRDALSHAEHAPVEEHIAFNKNGAQQPSVLKRLYWRVSSIIEEQKELLKILFPKDKG